MAKKKATQSSPTSRSEKANEFLQTTVESADAAVGMLRSTEQFNRKDVVADEAAIQFCASLTNYQRTALHFALVQLTEDKNCHVYAEYSVDYDTELEP